MYFWIRDTLQPCTREELKSASGQYVALLTTEEWRAQRESFDMGIELEPVAEAIFGTKADVNYDSLTGTFCVPVRTDLAGEDMKFAFALDEKGVVFIDDTGTAGQYIEAIRSTKRWRLPGLERFLYDFIEQIIHDDLSIMENYERELDAIEESADQDDAGPALDRINDIRSDIRELRIHYEQLLDFSQELEENENHFFKAENLRYFRLLSNRVSHLRDVCSSLRDYTAQIRDLYASHLDIRQNRVMTILTVVTTIFMPLTLITGWYGMNFHNMPELSTRWGYPAVLVISVIIVVISLWYFKRKKWL